MFIYIITNVVTQSIRLYRLWREYSVRNGAPYTWTTSSGEYISSNVVRNTTTIRKGEPTKNLHRSTGTTTTIPSRKGRAPEHTTNHHRSMGTTTASEGISPTTGRDTTTRKGRAPEHTTDHHRSMGTTPTTNASEGAPGSSRFIIRESGK